MANIDLPLLQMQECTFSLLDGTVFSPFDRGHAFNVTQVSDPVWKLKVQTSDLTRAKRQAWSAWKNSLRGGLNRLKAFDVARASPLAYLSKAVASDISPGWAGTGIASVIGASGALTITGLPPGYIASAGDRVGLEQSSRFGYYEILSGAVANGSGVLALSVAPFLHTEYFTAGATARLFRPAALFMIDWRSWSLPETSDYLSPATFEAYQVLK